MNRRIKIERRFEHELKEKIKEWENRGYELVSKGLIQESRGSAEIIKYWAIMKEKTSGD